MIVFVGMETSGQTRRAFHAAGHIVISCDLLPAQDAVETYNAIECPQFRIGPLVTCCHIIGDIFEVLEKLKERGYWPDLAIFHPDCTYHTVSAAWAFGDGPYHQKVKPGTLVGQARRDQRDVDTELVKRIWALPIKRKCIENPVGTLSTRFMRPTQVIQPYWFGDDASKATCLWLDGLFTLKSWNRVPGRQVEWPAGSGNIVERWDNQTDSGQNRLPPSANRWQKRADTYPGISAAMVQQWG